MTGSDQRGRRDPDQFDEWLRRGAQLSERSFEITRQMQQDWDDMALTDRSWTTDTIMNEVVNSWERFTPVMGDWIQHGVDGTGITLRSMWPDAPGNLRRARERIASAPGGDGAASYIDVSADAAERMINDEYTSADVVEDWANVCGKLTKDAWAAAAKLRRQAR
mgnify:CR=1 FL=1